LLETKALHTLKKFEMHSIKLERSRENEICTLLNAGTSRS